MQVTTRTVRLLRGAELLQEVDLQLKDLVARASLEDPHLLIVSEKGEIALLTLAEQVFWLFFLFFSVRRKIHLANLFR